MEIIKLDGTTLCYLYQDDDVIHLGMLKNSADKALSGTLRKISREDCPAEYDYRIDISHKTYSALVSGLLAYADPREFADICTNRMRQALSLAAQRKTQATEKK